MGEREEAEDGELHPPTEDAIKNVLVFADGLAVMHTGLALADLYAEDCESAQGVLRWAGCHERGKDHPDLGTRNPLPNLSVSRSTTTYFASNTAPRPVQDGEGE
jgi:hypothetical protein